VTSVQVDVNFPRREILDGTVLWSRGQMAESHLDFTRPSHVVGRYALYGRLAAGGMATVHLGRLMEADGSSRTVAVKRLHPQFCKDPEFVAMFIDEARLAARIKHPNVVETLDILTMGQELLLVMEYIRGECFSKLLRAARRKNLEPSIGVVGRIAYGMLHGLHAAHEATDDRGEPLNVVHRDISPQNVMIDAFGGVKVLDFGVAKASARIQITRDGQMKGKLSYMSPEQLQGLPVDRRADVFACGVVLWEALTRRRLFVGEDASEVLRKILRDEVPPPSQWALGLRPEVDQVVLRALSKDPDQRYQTALELATDVEKIIELAPDSDVAAWIESVAGEILGKRERLLSEIERSGPSEFSFSSGDAAGSLPPQGSITESDTFQRIQSWAEREAARVAADAREPMPSDVDGSDLEPTRTVADSRCVDVPGLPELGSAPEAADLADVDFEEVEDAPEAEELESAVTLAEEPIFGSVPLSEVVSPNATPSVGGVARETYPQTPVFAQATMGMVERSRQRGRRLFVAMAAAAALLGAGVFAVIGVKPTPVVSASGSLLPDAPAEREAGSLSAGSGVVAANQQLPGIEPAALHPAALRTEAVMPGQITPEAAKSAAVTGEASSRTEEAKLETAKLDPVKTDAVTFDGIATAAPPKVEPASARVVAARDERAEPTPKRAVRRPVAARRRAAPPPAPKAAATAKVDCRQPFWIDEGGIRRLKLACL